MSTTGSKKSKMLQKDHDCARKLGRPSKSNPEIDDYCILKGSSLPPYGYFADNLSGSFGKEIKWGTTTEFDRYGKNHCASVSIFNAIQYYGHRLNDPGLNHRSRPDIFQSIYALAGRGPTAPLAYRSALRNSMITPYRAYTRRRAVSWSNYVAAIRDQRMIYLVLWPSLFNAHYVNGIGFREYYSGGKYVRIVDNWSNTTDRYYCWDTSICRFMGYVYISE